MGWRKATRGWTWCPGTDEYLRGPFLMSKQMLDLSASHRLARPTWSHFTGAFPCLSVYCTRSSFSSLVQSSLRFSATNSAGNRRQNPGKVASVAHRGAGPRQATQQTSVMVVCAHTCCVLAGRNLRRVYVLPRAPRARSGYRPFLCLWSFVCTTTHLTTNPRATVASPPHPRPAVAALCARVRHCPPIPWSSARGEQCQRCRHQSWA